MPWGEEGERCVRRMSVCEWDDGEEESEFSEWITPEQEFILQHSCSFCKHAEGAKHILKSHTGCHYVFWKPADLECIWSFQNHSFGRALWSQEDDHYYVYSCCHASVILYEMEVPNVSLFIVVLEQLNERIIWTYWALLFSGILIENVFPVTLNISWLQVDFLRFHWGKRQHSCESKRYSLTLQNTAFQVSF